MYKTQNVVLDIRAIYADIYLDATQFDTDRVFSIVLVDGGVTVSTTGKTATFEMEGIDSNPTITNVNNTLYVQFNDTYTMKAGKWSYQLTVGNDKIHGTIIINQFLVDYSLLDDHVTDAEEAAEKAKSYAVGDTGYRVDEDTDNAKYYYNLIKTDTFGLCYVADIGFTELPDAPKHRNYMYKIVNEFTSNSSFEDGGGVRYPAGCYVYYTENNKWDCFVGAGVVGAKGDSETTYRKGNVSIGKDNVGLSNGVNVAISSSTPSNDEYWLKPYSSGTNYQPYKTYYYDEASDSYKLMSLYAQTTSIVRPNGATLESEFDRIDEDIDNIINDSVTETTSTWSSEKIEHELDNMPKINDNIIATNQLWSSEKTSRYRQYSQIIGSGATANIPMFEGMFAIIGPGSTDGIVGILDRWGGITYINNAGSGFATVSVDANLVNVTNNSNSAVTMFHFTTYYFG